MVPVGGLSVSRGELDAMIEPLERRGPDGANAWVGEGVALGHTLLATTPEAALEKLPLSHDESRCVITADARIDNRKQLFAKLGLRRDRRVGDGELILLAYLKWGEGCVDHLLGDFAFAIWDARSRRLFCARDHVGMRQLVYCHVPGKVLLFATEPAAILAHPAAPREVNEGRIADYLEGLDAFDLRETFFTGVLRLPPAHALVFDGRSLSYRRYWEPRPVPQLRLGSDKDYADAFLEIFGEAVRCRLRSHGPVGATLSGGLDSGSVVAVAARELAAAGNGPLHTFSAVGPDARTCIETRSIAAALTIPGIQATLVSHDELDAYLDDLARLIRTSGEPFDGTLTLLRAVYLAGERAGINVVLDGAAGDLTVGAGWTVAHRLRKGRFAEAVREARGESAFWGSEWPALTSLAYGAWRAYSPHRLRDLRRKLTAWVRGPARSKDRLISSEFATRIDLADRYRRADEQLARVEGVGADQRAASMAHPSMIAARERLDRVASASGIEPRDPFLDLRLIDFCLSLPPEQLQSQGWPKLVLRNAMAGLLPDSVRWRRGKQHLGWTFTRKLFRQRPELDGGIEEYAGTISPYVDLRQAARARESGLNSSHFAGWLKAVYLAMWLESVRKKARIAGSERI